MNRISQQQLESYLWGAAVLLRGTIDAGDYKQFIFPLLFYKRLCDVFDEETRGALEESGGDAAYAAGPEQHRFQIPPEAHWGQVRQTATNVGAALQGAMRAIETANPDKLYGIFGDAQWTNKNRLSDETLRDLVEHFSTLDLSIANLPEDELGNGYEYLIKKFADDSGHTAAEFYTNRTVVHLMTELLEPQPGESVYDPTCGSGGMLLSCIAHLRRKGLEWRNVRLYGQERNLMTSSIARMNCFLHGVEDFQIVRGDTLSDPKLVEGDRLKRFDVVLANPPYSIKQWDRAAFASDPWGRNLFGTPPQGRADYAFIQHILASLTPERGRCAVLLPHGVLFRQEEADIRRKLIEGDLLEAVIGLGPNLFYNSPMEACILVCRAKKPRDRRGRVLFVNAVNEVARERAQSFLTEAHIDRILGVYRSFTEAPGFARVAPVEELRSRDGNLSLPLYVSPPASVTDDDQLHARLNEAFSGWQDSRAVLGESVRALLPDCQFARMQAQLMELGSSPHFCPDGWAGVRFGDVVDNVNDLIRNPLEAGVERFIGLEHLEPGSLQVKEWGQVADGTTFNRRCLPGQVLFGKRRAYQRKVAVADFAAVVSGDIYVLAARASRLLPQLLPSLCQSERFYCFAVETSAGSLSPRTNWTQLAGFEFKLPPLDIQHRISALVQSMDSAEEGYRATLNAAGQLRRALIEKRCLDPNLPRATLGSVLDGITAGKSLSGSNDPAGPNTFGVLKVSAVGSDGFDVTQNKRLIDQSQFCPDFAVQHGDFLITRCNTTELVGRVCRVPHSHPNLMLSDKTLRLSFNAELADPIYMEAILKSRELRTQVEKLATGTGSAMKNISQQGIRSLRVPLPPLPLQQALSRQLQAIADAETCVRASMGAIQDLRSSLVNRIWA